MSIRSILLRLFLSIVLLFDGTATAVAAVHMNHLDRADAAAQLATTENPDANSEMPCHDASAAQDAMALHSDAGGHGHGTSDAETPPPDCCESGACDCACMHPAQAAVVSAAVDLGSLEHTDSVRPMFSVHASPSLPHLIRPPIG